ncbi:phosphoribosyltransferase family protein [Streptomyces sp. B-S-A8]|uniref:Phosphoribosyltransferase family protein n=1 Tax=Streptomyces solicavernae TaxID=3043614 RepID=A0ABT6RYF2_9ACTN|nr:phosphoribosyltransferase family protein [Streptomyces sp. B-S-A8]MDI3389437.1 phosphoribosyltransferase family protein [Streptomyces sp. B-S-A8]
MRGWWRDLADLVLPADCAGCGQPRTLLCDTCRAALYGREPRRARPNREPAGLPEVYAAAPYADGVRPVLLAHKERGALGLAHPLGLALAGAVRAGLRDGGEVLDDGGEVWSEENRGHGGHGETDGGGAYGGDAYGGGARRGDAYGGDAYGQESLLVLVPMPSAGRAVAARGHDSVRRIAREAARELRHSGIAAQVLPVLRQRRRVADQSGLNSRQRMANMSGALEVLPGAERLLAGRRLVLVDDLMTTGASLAEAARALTATRPGPGAAGTRVRVTRTQVTPPVRQAGSRERGRGGTVDASIPNARSEAPRTIEQRGMFPLTAAVIATSPDSFEINRN